MPVRIDCDQNGRVLTRTWFLLLAMLAVLAGATVPGFASVPGHNIIAANVQVIQNDTNNVAASVTVTTTYTNGDFRIRASSNRGDFNVQIGDLASDDWTNGIMLSSVSENGRTNAGESVLTNLIYSVAMTQPAAGGYFIPVNTANGLFGGGANPEWNVNFAAAYFPYSNWLGGYAFNLNGDNGSATATNDTLIGSPQLAWGVNYIDKGSGGGAAAGKSIVSLLNLGIDSRVDGVLLVCGAKNESSNYALSQPNTNNGTWNLFVRDTANTVNGEQDPIAFVFIPKTNTTVVSGRFRGDATIDMYSGASPQFTVSKLSNGRYELKVPGRLPSNGVLIISPEGGGVTNFDNIVNYQVNGAGDGWVIESRDTPGTAAIPAPPLESPAVSEGVCSFVYIPGPTPGFTVIPTNSLITTESGGTATFTVNLQTAPTDDVTISVTSSDLTEGTVDQSSLTFHTTDWYIPQTVTITGQDDALVDGTIAYSITLGAATSTDTNYNGVTPPAVSVVNVDNEGGITVSPTSGLITTEAGGTATFAIHLNTAPSDDVTINLSSSDLTEGTVSPSSVTFNAGNYNVDQIVTVTGVDDPIDDGDIAYTIITAPATSTDLTYNGLNAPDVSVVNVDDETSALIVSAAGPNIYNVVEGKTNAYTVALSVQPTSTITVGISSTDSSQGGTVSPSTLTFTTLNWSNAQVVVITGADDFVPDADTNWYLTNKVTAGDAGYLAAAPVPIIMRTLNNEALLTFPSGTNIYGAGQSGVGVDGLAILSDANTSIYTGGTLTAVLSTNGVASDRLEIRSDGTGPGQIATSGANVSYGGTTIGTFTSGPGTTPLVITFNSAASPAAAQQLLHNITFSNTNSVPPFGLRTVTFTLVHPDGGTSSGFAKMSVGYLRCVDFQLNADHGYGTYTGEADCHIQEAAPNTAFPAGGANGLFIDWPTAGSHNALQVLMRFSDMFGDALGQVPTNAIIVSADLCLNIQDSGDGSPFYRMIQPFDGTNDTWSGYGSGVATDDTIAKSTFDSALHTSDPTASTGTGLISVSVRPDIQVWQSGVEANNGWVLPGWPGSTDGTGITPGESATVGLRPRIRILWLPNGYATETSFRQNVNSYTNTVDTRIRGGANATNQYATVATVFVDYSVTGTTGDNEQVLMRFDNIIGSDPGQIPLGSTVYAAMLDIASTAGNAPGAGGTFHMMLQPWSDTNSWNDLVNGISADDVEAAAAVSAQAGSVALSPLEVGGYHEYELTSDVRTWVSGAKPNYGWAILPWTDGNDGWALAASENGTERDRPRLRVYYTPNNTPVFYFTSITRGPSSTTLQFTGPASSTFTVLRSTTVGSGYTSNGVATTIGNGTGSYIDNSPPPGAAFYRLSSP